MNFLAKYNCNYSYLPIQSVPEVLMGEASVNVSKFQLARKSEYLIFFTYGMRNGSSSQQETPPNIGRNFRCWATRMARGLCEMAGGLYTECLRERRRLWSGRLRGFEFKRRNRPSVRLGSCSQAMLLHKEIVLTLRRETTSSELCQTALWNETDRCDV